MQLDVARLTTAIFERSLKVTVQSTTWLRRVSTACLASFSLIVAEIAHGGVGISLNRNLISCTAIMSPGRTEFDLPGRTSFRIPIWKAAKFERRSSVDRRGNLVALTTGIQLKPSPEARFRARKHYCAT